mgnify:CR=1 FL=1
MGRCLLFAVLLGLSLGLGSARDAETGPAPAVIEPNPVESALALRLFTEALGHPRKISQKNQQLIILSSPSVEMAWALGRGENEVARSKWAARLSRMRKLSSLGPIIRPNQGLVLMLEPDAIEADMHYAKFNAQNCAL